MKALFFVLLFFSVIWLYSAPLESGFALAPVSSASREEKSHGYYQIRHLVIEAAKKYEGTPYVYGGMTSRGLDCSGFIGISFRDALGISIPRSAAGLYSWAERIPLEKAQGGDLLFFRTGNTRSITHVGLYLGNGSFIHSASAGARTGVIYSNLNEQYWARTFASAGRALPEGSAPGLNGITTIASNGGISFHVGAALAPTWDVFYVSESFIRGFTSQLGFYTAFTPRFVIGLELRPEYDGVLGVFRLPLTLSVGINEKVTIFAGPALSFGEPFLTFNDEQRNYSGGTGWLGNVGITYVPISFNIKQNEFAPYLEAAWQSYFNDNPDFRFIADTTACFRFSTGIRWRMQVL